MKIFYTSFLRAVIFCCLLSQTTFAQLYLDDPSFESPTIKKTGGLVSSFIIQPDNKILVMGSMNFADDVYTSSPVRLNADGTRDTTFHTDPFVNSSSVALREDGKIVLNTVVGYQDGSVVKLMLLGQNGNLDSTFVTTIASGSVLTPRALAVQKNNKVIVGSLTFENGSFAGTVNRVNTDGTLDNTFSTGDLKITWIGLIVMQPDGKIIIAGDFEFPVGTVKKLMRLNSNGSIDEVFNPSIGDVAYISAIVCQQDGKILVGTNHNLMRLNADGTTDLLFNSTVANPNAIALQPDGRVLVSNYINYINERSQVLRLNADGTNDPSFVSGEGASEHEVTALGVTASGDILAGGYFSEYNDQPSNGLLQLRGTDGSIDLNFHANLETSAQLESVIVTPDDKILIAGSFNVLGHHPLSGIARYNSNGGIDHTFNIGTGMDGFWNVNPGWISSVTLQVDEKILVGGYFTSFNGQHANGLLRLHSDGSTDETFTFTDTTELVVATTAIQTDGKIVVGGYNLESPGGFCKRLNPDGSTETTFNTVFNGAVMDILLQEDGKIILHGNFTNVNNTAVGHIVRLNTDGSIDNTFLASGTNGTIDKVLTLPDGKIMVGGSFSDFNGSAISGIVRLQADGTLDPTFNANLTNAHVRNIFVREDGKILLTGFIDFDPYQLVNSDGSPDDDFFILSLTQQYFSIVAVAGTKIIAKSESRLIAFYALTDQTIDFPAIPDKTTDSPSFALEATATSGLPVSYAIVSGPATVSGNLVTLTGNVGEVVIRAYQDGNATYVAATPVEQSFMVKLVTGIENNEQYVKLYPIPASDKLIVELAVPQRENISLRLFDIRGAEVNLVTTKVPSGFRIDTATLPRGLYILNISGSTRQSVHKILVDH